MGESGKQGTVYQRVRNKNNLEDLHLRRRIDELHHALSFEMYRIEMERLDCKMFLKEIRNCDSDDLSEFAPLFPEYLNSNYRGRRTRFRDLYCAEDLDVDRYPLQLDYKMIRTAPEKLRRPTIYLAELMKSKTLTDMMKKQPTRTSISSGSQGNVNKMGTPLMDLPNSRSGSQGQPGAIITLTGNEGSNLIPSAVPPSVLARRRSTLDPIPASPESTLEDLPANVAKDQKGDRKSPDGRISASLPNIARNHSDISVSSPMNQAQKSSDIPGAGRELSFMRNMLEVKQKIRKKKRRPLDTRIKAFYKDVEELLVADSGPSDLYLPPIGVN